MFSLISTANLLLLEALLQHQTALGLGALLALACDAARLLALLQCAQLLLFAFALIAAALFVILGGKMLLKMAINNR
jgi:hypothetical protein